jgi:hypothetical protein
MNVLRLNHAMSRPAVMDAARPCVYVDGRRHYGLQVTRWTRRPLPVGDQVELTIWAGESVTESEDLRDLPAIGTHVDIDWGEWGTHRFVGVVSEHTTVIGERGEGLAARLRSRLADALDQPVVGRWQLSDDRPTFLMSGQVAFNADSRSLASAYPVPVGSRTSPVFETQDGPSRRWMVADALAYLLMAGLPGEFWCPSHVELCQRGGGVDAGEYAPGDASLGEALAQVAARGGMSLRISNDGMGVVAYRPGIEGSLRRIGLQASGESLDPDQSNVWQATVNYTAGASRPGVLAIGDLKQYEATFPLQPGWDPERASDRWRDVARGFAEDWLATGDVYRKWVLNEHGQNSWATDRFDFSAIAPEAFPLRIARRFEPCLTTGGDGQSVGVVIEVSLDGGVTYERWSGPAWVSDDECAVYLGGQTLPADYFQAAIDDLAAVRVTATVSADTRLYAMDPGDHGLPRKTVRTPGLGYRKIHHLSVLGKSEAAYRVGERDDASLLGSIARRVNVAAGKAVDASITFGWIGPTCQVGDRVDRVEGRALELGSHAEAMGAIVSVTHDLLEQTTHVEVEG